MSSIHSLRWIHGIRSGTLVSLHLLPSLVGESSAFVNTSIDWKETPEAHVFKADLPGLKKEEVKVEIEDDRVLQISGQRKVEKEDKNDKWHRVERSSGSFMRRFRLPESAKMDKIKAAMENGVLTVTVRKEEVKKPEVRSIEISEGGIQSQLAALHLPSIDPTESNFTRESVPILQNEAVVFCQKERRKEDCKTLLGMEPGAEVPQFVSVFFSLWMHLNGKRWTREIQKRRVFVEPHLGRQELYLLEQF
ncbi:hypothetical protein K2173_025033 [Erythroxylum novogranatense]|uniref:SHSP domain-containing protein n=1 Tax=Erythroxylum novogranatense TaxID=1862640 RepID=A0AAV8UD79_9ROSI|nr:hypothetical protein K2173_025033 [Erythroxylum novogranatense]